MSTSEAYVDNAAAASEPKREEKPTTSHRKGGDTDAESRSDWPLDELILDNLGPCYGWTKIANKGTAMAAYKKDGGLLTFWLATGKVSLCQNRVQVFRRDTNMRGAEALFLDPRSQNESPDAAKETRPCRFGAKCSRPDCRFEHGSSRRRLTPYSTTEKRETGTRETAGGPGGSRGPCRYGSRCTRPDCWFDHP